MTRTRLALLFIGSALVSGTLTLAPRAKAYYQVIHPIACVPYHYAFGYQGQKDDFSVNGFSVTYTGYPQLWDGYLICAQPQDTEHTYAPYIRARFSRYPNAQNPLIQACSNQAYYGACTGYFTTSTTPEPYMSFFMDIQLQSGSAGYWSWGGMNSIYVRFLPTSQDWGKLLYFQGLTIGDEFGHPGLGSSGPF